MEIELKLLLDPGDNDKLRDHPLLREHARGLPRRHHLAAIYFDTADFHLRNHGAGLRVRQVDGRHIQTLKAGGGVQGGLHSRNEWEVEVGGDTPDLGQLQGQMDQDAWDTLFGQPGLSEKLLPLFTVKVTRTAWDLEVQGAEIELVLDEGRIEHEGEHDSRRDDVNEIELELKSGDSARLFDFALRLAEDIPLRLGNKSKAQRGYALLQPAAAAESEVVKAQALVLTPELTVGQALQAILANCLAQVHGNESGVTDSDDPESVHQMRVGLRRLRSALKLFRDVAPCPAELNEELRWLAGELGAARDWEVLSTSTLAPVFSAQAGNPEVACLQDVANAVAREHRHHAAQALQSPRYTRLMLTLSSWMQNAGWRADADTARSLALDEPVARFAMEVIARTHRKIIRRGKHIPDAEPAVLHRLRIAAKQGRYAMEFFRSLFKSKRSRLYLETLSAMQDELGLRNDVAVAEGLLQRLQEQHPVAAAGACYARGYLAGQAPLDRRSIRKEWKRFRRQGIPRRRKIAASNGRRPS